MAVFVIYNLPRFSTLSVSHMCTYTSLIFCVEKLLGNSIHPPSPLCNKIKKKTNQNLNEP